MLEMRAAHADEAVDSRFQTVVTAARTAQRLSDAAAPMDLITRAEIERTGARDASEVLALHPSLQIERSFAGAGAYVQGLNPQHVLVLIDGQRMIGRVNGTIDLSRIPVERIEQIEVVRGASSVLYGSDALGGVINIVTRKAQKRLNGDVSLQYGTFHALDLRGSIGTRLRFGSATLTAGWHRRDPYRLSENQVSTSGSGMDEQQASLRMDLRVHPRAQLGLSAAYLRRRMSGVDSFESGAVLERTNLTETVETSLTPEVRISKAAKLRLVAQYSFFRDQYLLKQRNGTQLDDYQLTREHLARVDTQLDWNLGKSHVLSAGGEFLYERLYTPRLASGFGDRLRGALFAQNQWRVSKALELSVIPALRVDVDSQFGNNMAPKLALRLAPWRILIVRFSYGAGFRAPSFKELLLLFENSGAGYVVQGNLNLKPETSQSLNLGIEVNPTSWLSLLVNGFRNNLRNLIQPTLSTGPSVEGPQRYTYGNIAAALTQGIELALRLRFSNKMSAEVGYTLTDSQDLSTHQELEGRARHRGNFAWTLRHPSLGLEFTARVSLVGPRPYYTDDDGDGQRQTTLAPLYALGDTRLGMSVAKSLQVFIGLQNILNAADARFLPIPPRAGFVGITGQIDRN